MSTRLKSPSPRPTPSSSSRPSFDNASNTGTPPHSATTSRNPSRSNSRQPGLSGAPPVPSLSPGVGSVGSGRRNRAALRDYYGLKAAVSGTPSEASAADSGAEDAAAAAALVAADSEIDRPGFEAQAYVKGLLDKETLEGLLKEEGSLVNQIKTLDGERKALVYDNYSKLIAATETIERMRAHMDPLAPTTNTLSPAVSHIALTAEMLAIKLKDPGAHGGKKGKGKGGGDAEGAEVARKKAEKETVKWVLGAPARLAGIEDEAEREGEWAEVKRLLDRWKGVGGVDKIREECERVMEEAEEEEESDEED